MSNKTGPGKKKKSAVHRAVRAQKGVSQSMKVGQKAANGPTNPSAQKVSVTDKGPRHHVLNLFEKVCVVGYCIGVLQESTRPRGRGVRGPCIRRVSAHCVWRLWTARQRTLGKCPSLREVKRVVAQFSPIERARQARRVKNEGLSLSQLNSLNASARWQGW